MEKLNFRFIPEQPLGRFIEPFSDMIQHGGVTVLRGPFESFLQKPPGSAADEDRTREETWDKAEM